MTAALKRPDLAPDADAPDDVEDGVVLAPEEEEEFEQMLAETDDDERAGRVHTLAEVLAKLHAA